MPHRILVTCLILIGSAVAQSQPIALTELSKGEWQGKNVTSKEILAYVIEFQNPHLTIYSHDYYFKPNGVMPGALEQFAGMDPAHTGAVLWAQYVDGTEWGDHNAGSALLGTRGPLLEKMKAMVDAYSRGGDKALSAHIESNKNTDDFALTMSRMQERAGIDGVIGRLKLHLASAAKHDKSLENK